MIHPLVECKVRISSRGLSGFSVVNVRVSYEFLDLVEGILAPYDNDEIRKDDVSDCDLQALLTLNY